MIVKKLWIKKIYGNMDLGSKHTKTVTSVGFFLFGIIPLYIKQIDVKYS